MRAQAILPADPYQGYAEHRQALLQVIEETLDSGWYILGKQVELFEAEFAAAMGARFGVGVASGTDAVYLALLACGIGPGDAVLTVSHTAVATVAAVRQTGALPVLVDTDSARYTIDPAKVEATIAANPHLRFAAIVPVHLYGHPADLGEIGRIAERHGLKVIEDCAQAHGATWRGRTVGSIGDCGAFSFYPTKNLGALGDGGAVLTNDEATYQRLRLLRQYGWQERYISAIHGVNSRLDELQAAILRTRLVYLEGDNARRRQIAAWYTEGLAGLPVELPTVAEDCTHVFHQYTIRTANRDGLQAALKQQGIHTAVLYPMPIHQQPGYRDAVCPGAGGLPNTERDAGVILSLPMYPQLAEADVRTIIGHVRQWFEATE